MPEERVFSLGGSHLAGYGQALLEHVIIQDDWEEYKPVGEETDRIIVTLLSDALIRDPKTGAYTNTLDPILGKLPKENVFVNTHVVGGFNRKWNLPLPQMQAIQAGSVFVYPADQGLLKRLQSLVITGIGERRAEGFGRIAINWHTATEILPTDKLKPITPPPYVLRDGECIKLAQNMTRRMLRDQLDQKLIVAVNGLKVQHPPNVPSNAQLSQIRIISQRALSEKNPQILIQHLNGKHLNGMKKAARDQFQRAWIGNQRLDEWLNFRAENVQSIWQDLNVKQKPKIGGIEPNQDVLALEYTVRLIDGVMRKMIKEAPQ